MVRMEKHFQLGTIVIANPSLDVEGILSKKRWPGVAGNIEFDQGAITSHSTSGCIL